MERKAVLFISPQPFFQWRGSPIRVKFNLLALSAAGYEVHLLTLPVGEDIPLGKVRVHRVANPFGVRQVPIGPNAWKLFFDVLLFLRGYRLCRAHRFTVIHGIEEAGLIAAVLGKWFKAGAIFEKHSDPFSYKGGWLKNLLLRIYARVEKVAARRADAVIGTGPGLVEQVTAMNTGTPAFNIPDIPSSLEDASDENRETIRGKWGTGPEDVLILYVGSFAVYQGVDLLFAIIPEVLRHSARARFAIIGGSAKEIAARRRMLEAQVAADRVVFAGTIDPDRLPDYLAASDILLSTRISGINTPLKVLDYLKAGRAIAATDVPANRLLLNEETAVFAPPESTAFAQRVTALAKDGEQRQRLGRAARKEYEAHYTLEHHKARLMACYEQVCGARNGAAHRRTNS